MIMGIGDNWTKFIISDWAPKEENENQDTMSKKKSK